MAKIDLSELYKPQGMLVLTEEEYLSSYGAVFMGGSELALHKNVKEGRGKNQAVARVQSDMVANNIRREELRLEYREKLLSGEIRTPSRIERLKMTARGNPDNESVQAARRLLSSKGINYD